MKKGLVIGKFMPVHTGHMALVEFALQRCDHLTVLLCYHRNEKIDGRVRASWLRDIYSGNSKVEVYPFEYDSERLSDSSVSSISASREWSETINQLFPDISVLFSSEKYGEYVAGYLGVDHIYFDVKRTSFPVSSSQIINNPVQFWDFIPPIVQPFIVRKIAIVGSESTGKSTIAERLAYHYHTVFVEEAAREIIGHTNECRYEDLGKIAIRHAESILQKLKISNRFLFIDTDINITKSYSKFLFDRELSIEAWIEDANRCDLYIFLEPDCPHVQDGTRIDENERLRLNAFHKAEFESAGIHCISISGNWQERFILAREAIDRTFRNQ